jgi:iron complex transport system ATP-binding protein
MSSVVLKDVVVRYGEAVAVGGVDLTVDTGAWVCLIGPNGAGKTSLLHAVAGLVPHEGTVQVDGVSLDGLAPLPRARVVALVPQRPVIPEDITVTDYALLGRTPHIRRFAVETRDDRDVVARVLERLELTAFASRLLGKLSGGELQRVLLARALAQQSPVLLLDEPTSALDLGHQQQVLHLVDELRRDLGLTVITTMHDLTLAGAHADTLVLLDGGQAVASGPPDVVLTAPLLRRYYHTDIEILTASDGTIAVVPLRSPGRLPTPPQAACSDGA